MATVEVDIPEEFLVLLKRSRLGDRPVEEQLRIALAAHLFQEGVISLGKAASVAGEPRPSFELLLAEMRISAIRYGVDEYQKDQEALGDVDRPH